MTRQLDHTIDLTDISNDFNFRQQIAGQAAAGVGHKTLEIHISFTSEYAYNISFLVSSTRMRPKQFDSLKEAVEYYNEICS